MLFSFVVYRLRILQTEWSTRPQEFLVRYCLFIVLSQSRESHVRTETSSELTVYPRLYTSLAFFKIFSYSNCFIPSKIQKQ